MIDFNALSSYILTLKTKLKNRFGDATRIDVYILSLSLKFSIL